MILQPQETERFYRIWWALLSFVNAQCHLVPDLPAQPAPGSVQLADAMKIRNALWADDALLDRFIAENPAALQCSCPSYTRCSYTSSLRMTMFVLETIFSSCSMSSLLQMVPVGLWGVLMRIIVVLEDTARRMRTVEPEGASHELQKAGADRTPSRA